MHGDVNPHADGLQRIINLAIGANDGDQSSWHNVNHVPDCDSRRVEVIDSFLVSSTYVHGINNISNHSVRYLYDDDY